MPGPGSKAGLSPSAGQGETAPSGRTPNPAAYTLVHAVSTKRSPLFTPTRLMNPVSYIGRTPQNDIVLGSDNVSRRHAKIIVTDMGVTVHDLDSHNGVFLNGKKVRSAPVNVGDLLYVADVAIELRRSPDVPAFSQGPATTAHNDITGEEDPDARSLAALMRVAESLGRDSEETFAQTMIEICRELVEATVAVLVQRGDDDEMATPVVLQPETGKPLVVLWPIVRDALDDGAPQVAADLKREPGSLSRDDAVVKQAEVGAVMVVPLISDFAHPTSATEAIYLARPTPGQMFTAREALTVQAIAQLAAVRRRKGEGGGAVAVLAGGDSHGDVLAAQAKAEAAEARLREVQQDVRALTERIHGLEADALRMKQQVEMEKQNAIDAKREADRLTASANKLEQGLHKTDEDVKRLKDALVRSEEERTKLKEAFRAGEEDRKKKAEELERRAEAIKSGEAEREQLRAELAELEKRREQLEEDIKARDEEIAKKAEELLHREDTVQRLNQELAKLDDEARSTREGLERAVSEQVNAADVLKSAMRATLPPALAEHIEVAASEQRESLATDAAVRPVAALFVALRGFDAWATTATPEEIKRRLDHFCNSVALRARANGGRVEQVLGHMHLLTFNADAASVRDAVRCGLEIQALVPDEAGAPTPSPGTSGIAQANVVGVSLGMHVGLSVTGFFGEGDTATHVETGEAVMVARSVAALSHESSFFITKEVQKLVAGDPAFVLGMAGPAAIVNGPNVVLYQVLPAAQPEDDDDDLDVVEGSEA